MFINNYEWEHHLIFVSTIPKKPKSIRTEVKALKKICISETKQILKEQTIGIKCYLINPNLLAVSW